MVSPSVVFLPGMMLDEEVFAQQRAALRSHQTSVADLSSSDSISGMATAVLESAPNRFALVGLSMGGIVALEVYRRAPERVTHLALLDTTPYADRPERAALRMEQLSAVERGELADVMRTSMKPFYLAARHRNNETLLKSILAMGMRLGPDVFRNQTLALRDRDDNRAVLPAIRCPALVLCGREDQLCPTGMHVYMAQEIPQADLLVLSGTGHLSPLEAPERVSSALRDLLERQV